MKYDQITALAREYAEEKARADREQGFSEPFINDMFEFYKKDMKSADCITLPKDSFPDLTWESDPIEVELIIKRKKK